MALMYDDNGTIGKQCSNYHKSICTALYHDEYNNG